MGCKYLLELDDHSMAAKDKPVGRLWCFHFRTKSSIFGHGRFVMRKRWLLVDQEDEASRLHVIGMMQMPRWKLWGTDGFPRVWMPTQREQTQVAETMLEPFKLPLMRSSSSTSIRPFAVLYKSSTRRLCGI